MNDSVKTLSYVYESQLQRDIALLEKRGIGYTLLNGNTIAVAQHNEAVLIEFKMAATTSFDEGIVIASTTNNLPENLRGKVFNNLKEASLVYLELKQKAETYYYFPVKCSAIH